MGKFLAILKQVGAAISMVEAAAGSVKGKDKLDAAITISTFSIPLVTSLLTVDEIKKEKIQAAIAVYINATIALRNIIKDETGKEIPL